MRIVDCRQQTEEWDRWRQRPTASEFKSFCTPARGEYAASSSSYAAKIVAKRLGVYTEPPPSFWMDWGTEQEPNAKYAYTQQTGRELTDVGFILPDHTDAFGGSPDALVGDEGGLEIKCPAPETLIAYHASGEFPNQYKPQVQGLMLISGRKWWDFFVFHPELTPFLLRVEADEAYQAKIANNLILLLEEIERIETKVKRQHHHLVSVGTRKENVRWEDE